MSDSLSDKDILWDSQQLRWRCRRGVRELDVLLERYLQQVYATSDLASKVAFQRLLETQDPTIMDWLFSRIPCDDPGVDVLVRKLRSLSGL